jgi:hypothetical protein
MSSKFVGWIHGDCLLQHLFCLLESPGLEKTLSKVVHETLIPAFQFDSSFTCFHRFSMQALVARTAPQALVKDCNAWELLHGRTEQLVPVAVFLNLDEKTASLVNDLVEFGCVLRQSQQ